ncbi:hypothetical protein T07_13822 [Trichinella nelsoni]|uniref:Uncharacterized protein n=1 Tax=Trichinella nelsoni TaxID=6336 RepID=A0A0V0S1G1_9BILA|nr:hypothetical protein T07_13822 [Trichinella nelsoni]
MDMDIFNTYQLIRLVPQSQMEKATTTGQSIGALVAKLLLTPFSKSGCSENYQPIKTDLDQPTNKDTYKRGGS